MKIIKYKKIKNKYRVYFDNEEVDLYEEIILKYNLLLKKEIDSKLLEEIKESNKNEEAYEKALNYINVKMRSRNELEKYLSKKEYDDLLIKNTIKRLENIGLINDELYIKSYISDKINLTNDGPNKIRYALINSGMNDNLVDKYIEKIDEQEVRDKLDRLIDKKISTIKNCSGNVLKYKLINYFNTLGYSKYMIEDILDSKDLKNNNGEKEYIKLYNKYSKKYSGYELDSIIKQKLYQKGFDINEIKKNID